jgi:hypothetical protein
MTGAVLLAVEGILARDPARRAACQAGQDVNDGGYLPGVIPRELPVSVTRP